MILISKAEAMYLINEKHMQWGSDLHHSNSRSKKYYATTSPKVMKALNAYRDSRKIN